MLFRQQMLIPWPNQVGTYTPQSTFYLLWCILVQPSITLWRFTKCNPVSRVGTPCLTWLRKENIVWNATFKIYSKTHFRYTSRYFPCRKAAIKDSFSYGRIMLKNRVHFETAHPRMELNSTGCFVFAFPPRSKAGWHLGLRKDRLRLLRLMVVPR